MAGSDKVTTKSNPTVKSEPDSDPAETQEWSAAFDTVLHSGGPSVAVNYFVICTNTLGKARN